MGDPANIVLEKKLNRYAWVFSAAVFLLVLFMRRIKVDVGVELSFLPAVYSVLNTITFFLLLLAFYFIKYKKDVPTHQKLMSGAVLLSGLFLILYVLYHITSAETLFCQEGLIRNVYFVLLISHIVLAAIILPFILFTYIRAYTAQFPRHKKLARWVWPLWLYVALTGPVIYLLLLPCY
jgi:putative membrane protein